MNPTPLSNLRPRNPFCDETCSRALSCCTPVHRFPENGCEPENGPNNLNEPSSNLKSTSLRSVAESISAPFSSSRRMNRLAPSSDERTSTPVPCRSRQWLRPVNMHVRDRCSVIGFRKGPIRLRKCVLVRFDGVHKGGRSRSSIGHSKRPSVTAAKK